jgi:hypothetical protein
MWFTMESDRLDWIRHVAVNPWWLVTVTALSAQAMFSRCLVNQSIPSMTSIPLEARIIRLARNTTPLRFIGISKTPK